MGGYGSGNWYRWNSKTSTESQKRIDIRWVINNRWLISETSNTLSWTCRGEDSGSVRCRLESDRLILNYRTRQNGGEWEEIEDQILFYWTPCNFGGKRQWFLCPDCKKRVAIIYGGKYFRCRHCHNLTYSSQQESEPDRLMRKARKIRERLGVSADLSVPIQFKPKNMHQKTFDRLRREAENANIRAWIIIGRRFGF